MTRKAIIIAAPQPNQTDSAEADASAWHIFLASPLGGAWGEQEIVRCAGDSREAIVNAVKAARSADYSLIVFIGPGQVVKRNLPWAEGEARLSNGDTLTERDLNPGSRYCTIFLDSAQRDTLPEPADTGSNDSKKTPIDPSGARELFQQDLTSAEAGLVKIYAMRSGSVASAGPSFSQLLIRAANQWAASHKGALLLPDAVARVKDAAADPNLKQQLTYNGGRRMRHFPLAVNP